MATSLQKPFFPITNHGLNKSHSTSGLQKNFDKVKPHKGYQRFLKQSISCSGLNLTRAFGEFMRKDLIKPGKKDDLYPRDLFKKRLNWALHTKKVCTDLNYLPKLQPLKEYNFVEKNKSASLHYQNSFLATDSIALRIPDAKTTEMKHSFLDKKGSYGRHSESYEGGWVSQNGQKTFNNTSSVGYNIINQEKNPYEIKPNFLDNRAHFKKKGVSELKDRAYINYANINKDYQSKLQNDDHLFHNYKGMFSNVYDVSHRNGSIIIPFQKGSITQSNHKTSV